MFWESRDIFFGITITTIICASVTLAEPQRFGKLEIGNVNHGYVLFRTPQTYDRAQKQCGSFFGAHLAIIDSQDEKEFLRGLMLKNRKSFVKSYNDWQTWVGVDDINEEGQWRTVKGDDYKIPSDFLQWAVLYEKKQGKDDFDHQANCGAFCLDGTLDDASCDFKFPYFCEWDDLTEENNNEYEFAQDLEQSIYMTENYYTAFPDLRPQQVILI